MCASPLKFLKSGPPAPRVALLSDAVFFSRLIPVAAGTPREEVVSQVGLALEALSPFPLGQLYHGYYLPEGAANALAFAAYRRRFTADQLAEWSRAEHVIPSFAAMLGYAAAPSTTLVLSAPDGLTALHWGQGAAPASVHHVTLAPGADEAAAAQARADLLNAAGPAKTVVDAPSPPVAQPVHNDREVVFEAGRLRSVLTPETLEALDVRDRADLEALKRASRRDLLLWRATTAAALACVLFLLAEGALVAGGVWQSTRVAKVAAQKPTVSRIMDEEALAGRIDELSTKRLLPLEMISIVSPEVALPKNPTSIQFLRAQTTGIYTIMIEAQTTNAGEIAGYKTALEQTAACDKVEIREQRARDNVVSFTLVVTFKPSALTPATS